MVLNVIGVLALLLFIVIAATYKSPFMQQVDAWGVTTFEGNEFLEFFHIIGNTETIIGLTLIFALLLFIQKRWQAALFAVLSVALGFGLNQLLKAIFQRPRPDIIDQLTSYSFPSGHAMATTICFCTLAYIIHEQFLSEKKAYSLYVVALVIGILVALSRVAGAWHFLTDVTAGVSMAVVFVILATSIYKKMK